MESTMANILIAAVGYIVTVVSMTYRYEVRGLDGRLWAQTMTRIKAARMVRALYEDRGVSCTIQEIA